MRSVSLVVVLLGSALAAEPPGLHLTNFTGPILDAHNCYPYQGKWNDRIDRALEAGFPVGIEQDIAWANGRPVVSHQAQTSGSEPALRDYFFEHVRPMVEKAVKDNNRASWPLIIVHFDFKDNRPELLQAVWALLGEYEGWLTTAPVTSDVHTVAALDVKPLLVLTEDNDAQEAVFFTALRKGGKLRLFGSAHTAAIPEGTREERMHLAATMAPEKLLFEQPTNYRRWWNNSWFEVEEGGQHAAGEWTGADDQRLRALVNHAHSMGYWIRFYTLDGFAPANDQGWGQAYNFGSVEAVRKRWQAALKAGVNLIATDQYEDLSKFMKAAKPN